MKTPDFNIAIKSSLKLAFVKKELKQAERFVVFIYKTISTGFAINVEGADHATLQKLISELKESKPTKLIGIYSGLISEDQIVEYFKQHSAK